MWLLELVLLSIVLGIPIGIGLRIFDEWQERSKAAAEAAKKSAMEATNPTKQG